MAFCNSCGTALAPGTKFCSKCGAAIAGSPVPAATPAPPATGGSSALKIVLIVVAVIAGLGILGVAGFGYFVYHVARTAHVRQEGNNVKLETPFGSVETSQDPQKAAQDLGVDIYPGAEVQKNGASDATIGKLHTVTAIFTSSDSLDKVCSFYKSKFPNAMVATSDQNRCNIVSNDRKNTITINIQASGDTTKIQITNINQNAASSN